MRLLHYRFDCKTKPGCLSDIFDGCLYEERREFFSNPYNISLNLNYDGAPKFKSSTIHIWPIQMLINDLPSQMRYCACTHKTIDDRLEIIYYVKQCQGVDID